MADGGPDGGGLACPTFASIVLEDQINQQEVIISRVVFAGGDATVFFRGINTGTFNFADPLQLCAGPDNCTEDVQDLDNGDNTLGLAQEVSVELTGVDPDEGEFALINGDPADENAFILTYIAYGEDFVSEAPVGDAGPVDTLETRADDANIFDFGERITVSGATNTIFADGDESTQAAGWDVCSSPL